MSLANKPLDILKRIPFFAQLAPAELEVLAEAVVVARYRKNQVLFVEGEPSHSLYFICAGRVKVCRAASDGRGDVCGKGGSPSGREPSRRQVDGQCGAGEEPD